MNPWLRIALAVSGAAFTLGTLPVALSKGDLVTALLIHPAAALYIGAGLVAWSRRPENRTGRVMVLTGFLLQTYVLIFTRVPLLWTAAAAFDDAWTVPLAFLLLSFPVGRLVSRRDRIFVWLVGLDVTLLHVVPTTFGHPREYLGCGGCPAELNLLLTQANQQLLEVLNPVRLFTDGLLLLTIIGFLVHRWVRATAPGRRIIGPVVLPGSLLAAVFLLGLATFYLPTPPLVETTAGVLQYLGYWLLPVGFLVGLLRMRGFRARVSDLVVELGDLPTPERFRDAVARALGDPSVEIGLWSADRQEYVTPDGRVLPMPAEFSVQAGTLVERLGDPLALIVHDRVLLEDARLVDAVTAAARLAVENERLQEEVLAQLAEVHASRARIIEAADEERRRVERNLHDGAQQRLVSLSLALQHVQAKMESADPNLRGSLSAATEELRTALRELRELAQGIHPAILTEEGLGPALQALAERSTIPIHFSALPAERLPAPVEAAAYYVVSEALANVAKYAEASSVSVTARRSGDQLVIEVEDDGRGGADITGGSGLRGLADRVEALDGSFTVDSPKGLGTRVRAEIPCA